MKGIKKIRQERISLVKMFQGGVYGRRGIVLLMKVVVLSLIPIIAMGLILSATGQKNISETMEYEVKQELRSVSLSIDGFFDSMGGDNFVRLRSGNVIKGTYVINDNYSLIDTLSEHGEVLVAIYYGDNLVVTSFRNEDGRRVTELPLPHIVKEKVLNGGGEYYAKSIYIDNNQYYAYYSPLHNADGTIAGVIFAGKSASSITGAISANRISVSTVTVGAMFAAFIFTVVIVYLIVRFVNMVVNEEEKVDELTRANRAKDSFLANMSHEIRTPINAILGMDEMILRENKDEIIGGYAINIKNAGQNLLALINDILDISKIQSGRIELIDGRYELASIMNDTYNMLAHRAEKKDLDFLITNDPNIPSEIYGDETRVRQVLTNLATNAIKYTEHGSVNISFTWDQIADNKMVLIMTVTDTGVGIKEEDMGKLFDSFKRLDVEKNRNIEGTGLGLAITKNLTELMGGSLEVKSVYGKGSTFIARIPQEILNKEPLGDFKDSVYNNYHLTQYHQSFIAPTAHILAVDDVKVNLDVISGLLKLTKVNIDTVTSGDACLELVMDKKYDLILMDHMMPKMDGVETLHYLKRTKENKSIDAPVIALTANAIVGAKEKYLEWGFDDYLSKPVQSVALENCLIKYLPKEKVQLLTAEEAEELLNASSDEGKAVNTITSNNTQNVENSENESGILRKLDFLDTETGLSYCLDEESYTGILNTYIEEDKRDEIIKCYENKQMDDYRILVHAVKSTSLYIGAIMLSDMAKAQEAACIEENWEFVEEHHEELVTTYGALIEELRRVLEN